MNKPFDVVCPACAAKAGNWCVVRELRRAIGSHKSRVKLSHRRKKP